VRCGASNKAFDFAIFKQENQKLRIVLIDCTVTQDSSKISAKLKKMYTLLDLQSPFKQMIEKINSYENGKYK
jgi:hypothetical protein